MNEDGDGIFLLRWAHVIVSLVIGYSLPASVLPATYMQVSESSHIYTTCQVWLVFIVFLSFVLFWGFCVY